MSVSAIATEPTAADLATECAPVAATSAGSPSMGVSESEDEQIITLDFDFDAADSDSDLEILREAASITGTVNLGPSKQTMKLNKRHTIRCRNTVKVNSNDELVPAQRLIANLHFPGVFKSPKSASKRTSPVKKNRVKTFSLPITVTGVVPKQAGKFELTGSIEYHGELFEKTVEITVK
ncbi:MAG: hypothetical protein AAF560_25715 [Acidobacteriota bacterium]